jgi:hypothetical protein
MAVTSQMDIVNLAIRNLALGNLLASLEDDDDVAQRIKANYDVCLDELLAEFAWSFATRNAKLARLDDFTPFHDGGWHWSHAYARPNDCVLVLKVGMAGYDGIVYGEHPFRPGLSDDGAAAILCRHGDAAAQFISRKIHIVQMPPAFVNAFAWLLAANVCLAQRADPAIANSAQQYYAAFLHKAKCHDADEMGAVPRRYGSWMEARRHG